MSQEVLLPTLRELRKDLREAAAGLGAAEVRYLVDLYYEVQHYRITAANQSGALTKLEEPSQAIQLLFSQFEGTENAIKAALEKWTDASPMGAWAKCAPPGSMVSVGGGRWGPRRQVPIESLVNGDEVTSFDRRRGRTTSPRSVTVGVRPYAGHLVCVEAGDCRTRVTPNHAWLTRVADDADGFVVYLMANKEGWYRVGRSRLGTPRSRGGSHRRMAVQHRATGEQASVWLLRVFSSEEEARVYEAFVAAEYGLADACFRPQTKGWGRTEIDALFGMLDMTAQGERAERCLADHNLDLRWPLWSWRGDTDTRQSGVQAVETAAANLLPEHMELPVPGAQPGTFHWVPIEAADRQVYNGPVHSLEVAQHHKYVQDGLVTCNSHIGIGPVIAAGLASHIDVTRSETVGGVWRFAGLDPTAEWKKGEKRPYNAKLKVLAWKIGESFSRLRNHDDCWYGHQLIERKAFEEKKNEAGEYAEQAAAIVKRNGYSKGTEARKTCEGGKLPPVMIEQRSRRWTAKLFLAHYFEHGRLEAGLPVPEPYPIAHLGHTHRREPEPVG